MVRSWCCAAWPKTISIAFSTLSLLDISFFYSLTDLASQSCFEAHLSSSDMLRLACLLYPPPPTGAHRQPRSHHGTLRELTQRGMIQLVIQLIQLLTFLVERLQLRDHLVVGIEEVAGEATKHDGDAKVGFVVAIKRACIKHDRVRAA